jgi:DNA-binding transcriptional ArsR family regulator
MMRPSELKRMRQRAAEAAKLLSLLSHEARLRVLCELVGKERSAGELVDMSGLSQSALSQHLAKLREHGIVRTRREAQTIYYALADAKAARIIEALYELYCGRT